jgi:glycine hydroxymethyltransferase
MSDFFTAAVDKTDPLIGDALAGELHRQQTQIELIASENIVSRAVLDALGHPMTNKTLEGYPGNRFHGGGELVDVVEQAAIDRARVATMSTRNRTPAPRPTRRCFSPRSNPVTRF